MPRCNIGVCLRRRARRSWGVRALITIDLANAIFVGCVLVGGGLLLATVLLDDILGGILDSLHLDLDLGGVSLMPLLLGFVSMFGVGGLIGTEVLNLDTGGASLAGGVFGLLGAGIVYVVFSFLRRAEAPEAFSLSDLVGQVGRVAVSIPAGRFGSVYLSYAGVSHNLTATAEVDVAAGSAVTVTGVAGSSLIVAPYAPGSAQGGASNA